MDNQKIQEAIGKLEGILASEEMHICSLAGEEIESVIELLNPSPAPPEKEYTVSYTFNAKDDQEASDIWREGYYQEADPETSWELLPPKESSTPDKEKAEKDATDHLRALAADQGVFDDDDGRSMVCPKCGKSYLEIHGTFDGTEKIQFKPDEDLVVVDSEPTDFTWDDHDTVICLECGHTGTVKDFEREG